MDHQALHVGHISQQREDLQGIDELPSLFLSALHLEGEDASTAIRIVFLIEGVVVMTLEGRMMHGSHLRMLAEEVDHALYKKYYPNGGASIFTFEVKGGQEEAWKFIDALQIFSLLANVADVKSLVIHPYTTTHSQLSPEELAEQHITPATVRLSIGTEHIDDIIDDLAQALDKI